MMMLLTINPFLVLELWSYSYAMFLRYILITMYPYYTVLLSVRCIFHRISFRHRSRIFL